MQCQELHPAVAHICVQTVGPGATAMPGRTRHTSSKPSLYLLVSSLEGEHVQGLCLSVPSWSWQQSVSPFCPTSASHWELFTVLCLHSSVHCGTAVRCDGASMGCCSACHHHLCFQSLCLLVLAKPRYCQPHLSLSITIRCTTLAWISGAMKNQYHAPLHHCHLAGTTTQHSDGAGGCQGRGQREKTQTNLPLPW